MVHVLVEDTLLSALDAIAAARTEAEGRVVSRSDVIRDVLAAYVAK